VAQQGGDSLRAATDQMIASLDAELATFRERIKSDNSVIVTRRPGSDGGGAGALGGVSLAGLLLGLAARRRRS
jgi:rhombotail lipoprotein